MATAALAEALELDAEEIWGSSASNLESSEARSEGRVGGVGGLGALKDRTLEAEASFDWSVSYLPLVLRKGS